MKNPARKKCRPMLSAFVDGELGPDERVLVERHLTSCKESADEVAGMRAVSGLVRRAMEEVVEQEEWVGFSDEVMARLSLQKLPFFRRLHIQLVESFTYQRNWILAGTSALVLVCFSVFMWTRAVESVGYGNPLLSIQTVTAKADAFKTIITQTETGDTVVWLVEEDFAEREGAL